MFYCEQNISSEIDAREKTVLEVKGEEKWNHEG